MLPVFHKNCIKCHGEKDKVKGKVNLLQLQSVSDLLEKPDLVKDLIDALDFEDMPPDDEPLLDPRLRRQMVTRLKGILDSALAARMVSLPHTPIRRMNRFQYSNAVHDLFSLRAAVFALPERMLRDYGYFQPSTGKMPERLKAGSRPLGKSQMIEKRLAGVTPFPRDPRAEHGFDNRGDHLSLSPMLLESFLKLSRSIVESDDFNERTCGIWKDFFAPPPEKEKTEFAVRKRLHRFLTRSFRGPVGEAVLDRYANYVMSEIQSGKSFTNAMKSVASAAIASPRFLYIYERSGGENGVQPLDDFELASRLSFFLWGSIPDQILLDLAGEGQLARPEVLSVQLDRMMNDVRMKRFCDSFPTQWLQLDRILSSVPDPKRYPEFYFSKYRASMHMMLEPLLLFETILVENRSILELIDSDISYRSDLLDSWYRDGTRGKKVTPTAIPFHRVHLSDRRQGGVITTAAVMTMTSNAERTQPITRGAWIADVIFDDPPEPPPANVPPLASAKEGDAKTMTLRERLDAHRQRSDCRGCHEKIDPLGFALENYGPTGVWRDKYENGRSVDSGGELFGKRKFSNIVEFKDAILSEKNRFARAFTSHLFSFALGREMETSDLLELDRIVSETAPDNFRLRSLLKQIAMSKLFLNKFNPVEPEDG